MPLLYTHGQHQSLVAAQGRLRVSEKILVFLDDVKIRTTPDRVGHAYAVLQDTLWSTMSIQGRRRVWNRTGDRPTTCDMLERTAHESDQPARVWTRSGIPAVEQGLKVLGTRWATLSTCQTSSNDSQLSTRPSWTGFPQSLTPSAHGPSSFTARQQGPTVSSRC